MYIINPKIRTKVKAYFSDDKEKFWFDYYRWIYLNNNISMFNILWEIKYNNSSCPKSVIGKLSDWFDDYSEKKYKVRTFGEFSTRYQFNKAIMDINSSLRF